MDFSQRRDVREPVSSVASRLRMFEDFNLASRLQDQEFDRHYAMNRAQRQLVGKDTRASRKIQEIEDHNTAVNRQQKLNAIAANDERLALSLQQKIEEEEKLRKEKIAELDAVFAKTLELRERRKMEEKCRSHMEAADAMYARELQEYYNARLKRNKHRQEGAPRRNPLLPSFIAKSLGKQRRSNETSTSQRGRLHADDNYDWADDVDENIQNELNVQMASVAARPTTYNDPPPAYSSLDHSTNYAPNRTHPLASIATRDSSSPTTRSESSSCGNRAFNGTPSDSLVQAARGDRISQNSSGSSASSCNQIPQSRQGLRDNRNCSSGILPKEGSGNISIDSAVRDNSTSSSMSGNTNSNCNVGSGVHPLENLDGNTLLTRLHPTNPFITDLVNVQSSNCLSSERAETSSQNQSSNGAFTYSDEFGLPPPSAFALGLTANQVQ